jgi:DNA primase
MRKISSETGPTSFGEAPREIRDLANSFTGNDTTYKDVVYQANSVPLAKVLNSYGLRIDERSYYNQKIICPFKSHKNGRESTPSFMFYPQTNTFTCFGCGAGSRACDFVSKMDRSNKFTAAHKILGLFSSSVDDSPIERIDFSEKITILLDFSNTVREFHQFHKDEESFKFIEMICEVYDDFHIKHEVNNKSLLSIVSKLKERINSYR